MRQVVLDTETTGLESSLGHRIIEVGCVELLNRRSTGRHFHSYLNPEREVDEAARAIHGMSHADLADTPRFVGYVRATANRYRALGPLLKLLDALEGRVVEVGYTF
jgi:DNA polymerase III epsilon subunit-like protein